MIPVPVNAPGVAEFSLQFDLAWLAVQCATAAILFALAFSGLAARIAGAVSRLTRNRAYPTLVLTAAACLVLTSLLTLPLAYGLDIVLVESSGRNAQAPGEWLADRGVGLLTQIVALALLIWIPVLLVRRLPRTWWLGMGALATVLIAATVTAEQVAIRPLTADYAPIATLEDEALRARIMDLLERCDVAEGRVLVGGDGGAGASAVVGIGPLARIYITPAAIAEKTPDQFEFTVAHELKHYLLHDNWLAFAVVGALALGGAFILHLAGGALLRRWGGRIGARSLADPAAFPAAASILLLGWIFIGLPSFNAAQRWAEWDADRLGLEATHQNEAHALWMAGRADSNLLVDYQPLFHIFRATHPSQADRVRLANEYRPWETGEERYSAICAPPEP